MTYLDPLLRPLLQSYVIQYGDVMPGLTQRLLPAHADQIATVAESLAAGELVLLPTETVYAIAFNLQSASARQRVEQIKPSTVQSPWVIHVAGAEQLLKHQPHLTPLARRLMAKTWPGPVAYQLPVSDADEPLVRGWLGPAAERVLFGQPLSWRVRCPDHSFTQHLLSKIDFPIAMVAASSPEQVANELSSIAPPILEGVDTVVDGGPSRYKKSSTLVGVTEDRVQVLRPGVIDERIVDRLAEFLIVFVCSGNTCRSPMAAAIARTLLARRLGVKPDDLGARRLRVASAGLHAGHGMPATSEAVVAAQEQGADLSTHFSQPATGDLLRRADVIYTMTDAHREEILDRHPEAAAKTSRLDPDGDIEDPIGYDQMVYSQVARHLSEVLESRLNEIRL